PLPAPHHRADPARAAVGRGARAARPHPRRLRREGHPLRDAPLRRGREPLTSAPPRRISRRLLPTFDPRETDPRMNTTPEALGQQSFYEAVGGHETFVKLVDRFYEGVA